MYGYFPNAQPSRANPELCTDYCPNRGPMLTHAHASDCPDKHGDTQCCHCAIRYLHAPRCRHERIDVESNESSPEPDAPEDGVVWIDVPTRLRELGLMAPLEPVDETPVEPKMVTGNGPTGPSFGHGRGELSKRDMNRLNYHVNIEEKRQEGPATHSCIHKGCPYRG